MRTRSTLGRSELRWSLALPAGVLLALLAGAACGQAPEGDLSSPEETPAAARLKIMTSIFPLRDVAQAVGGDLVTGEELLPPGASPHGYEPKPPQVERLARADLLLVIGLGADPWATRAASACGNPRLRILELADAVPAESLLARDPHAWLDPLLMERFSSALADTLCALRPGAAAGIRERQRLYAEQLFALDREYRDRLGAVPTRAFLALHAAFGYVARRYGLRQAALLEAHMEEPGPETLEHVVAFIRAEGIRVIFTQPQVPASAVAWLREQTGVTVGVLDPLGRPGDPEYGSYLTMMRSNLDALAGALEGRE